MWIPTFLTRSSARPGSVMDPPPAAVNVLSGFSARVIMVPEGAQKVSQRERDRESGDRDRARARVRMVPFFTKESLRSPRINPPLRRAHGQSATHSLNQSVRERESVSRARARERERERERPVRVHGDFVSRVHCGHRVLAVHYRGHSRSAKYTVGCISSM